MKQRVLLDGVNGDIRPKTPARVAENERLRMYRKTQKGKATVRKHNVKRCYGLSLGEYDRLRLLATHCPVCEMEFVENATSRSSKHLDHNHKTGVIRGIICGDCNLALGHMKDNVEAILKLAEWAKR